MNPRPFIVSTASELKQEYYLSDAMEEEALLPKTERRTFCSKARGKVIALRSVVTPTGQSATTTWEYYAHGGEREARLVKIHGGTKFGTDEVSFFLYDHLGNTRMSYTPKHRPGDITIVQVSVNAVMDYYPYGKILREYVNLTTTQERYLTTQHERDKETGLDYRGARYYDADVARFLSLDPLAKNYPDMNPYFYVAGNPLRYIDPSGRSPENADGTEDPREEEHKKTGWTEKHLQLLEAFGDPNGFGGMISSSVQQNKSTVQDKFNRLMKDPVNKKYSEDDIDNISTQFNGYDGMKKTSNNQFTLEAGWTMRNVYSTPSTGTMKLEKASITISQMVNGKRTKVTVDAVKVTFSEPFGFLNGRSKIYSNAYIYGNLLYVQQSDGKWIIPLDLSK